MLPEDVQNFLTENVANVEVVGEIREALGIRDAEVNREAVIAFLETTEGQAILRPLTDKTVTTAIETWKANNLTRLVQAEYMKKHPPEDEKDRRIRELEDNYTRMEYEKKHEALKSTALQTLVDKGLPADLIQFVVADDDAQTEANLSTIAQVWSDKLSAEVTKQVDERFQRSGGGHPPKVPGNGQAVNPWRKETFNLTKQGEITQADPALALSLKAEAAKGG